MTSTAVPQAAELVAPPAWRAIDFISDLHLQAADAATFRAWQGYLERTTADAMFILGDLFEVWIGDDAVLQPGTSDSFEHACARVLAQAAAARPVYFMHGNRDFLVGPDLMAQCGTSLLADPTVLVFAGRRWLLSHGDALCLDDTDYMVFRAQVRTPHWQDGFLARPLAERREIALGLRQQSEARKQSGATYADIDSASAHQWMQAARAPVLIHGHTHKPAEHTVADGYRRVVLSDWDASAHPSRLQVLRLSPSGLTRLNLAESGAVLPRSGS